jgi:excisionase family DNA binding protein
MTTSIEKQGLSVNEACAVAGIGKTKLYQAIGAGQLACRKFGKRTIVLREDLNRFLAALPLTNVEIKPPSAPAGCSPTDRTAPAPHSRTVVEQLPAVTSKAQPKEVRGRARRLNPPDRFR